MRPTRPRWNSGRLGYYDTIWWTTTVGVIVGVQAPQPEWSQETVAAQDMLLASPMEGRDPESVVADAT